MCYYIERERKVEVIDGQEGRLRGELIHEIYFLCIILCHISRFREFKSSKVSFVVCQFAQRGVLERTSHPSAPKEHAIDSFADGLQDDVQYVLQPPPVTHCTYKHTFH
jgi:hypothetical protein